MASEASDGPAAVSRLAALLTAAAGTAPTPREIAEVLWLAGQSETAQEAGPTPPDPPRQAAGPVPHAPDGQTPGLPSPAVRQAPPDPRVPLHLPAPDAQPDAAVAPGPDPGTRPPAGGPSLLAPAPPMLHRPLALQRALRPLKRRVPEPRTRVLDERATADRIARLGAHPDVWLPVLRPAHDRWLRLNLVHDTGPTMPLWRPLVRELHTVLAQSGVFRTVTLHPVGPDGRARHVPVPADGRTVTLVLSDCMGPQWRPGAAGTRWYATLRHWAAHVPLAVVQPLPEHLWHTTALPAEPGLLSARAAAAPTATLTFTPYDPDPDPDPGPDAEDDPGSAARPPGSLPLPVLEPGAPWLANWASLLAGPGGTRLPGAAARLAPAPPEPAAPAGGVGPSSPQDLVLRFRATASPEAFRLAGHLALAVPSVPVMRLVQRTVERDPRPQHLAEVVLSGMLTATPGSPGHYAFRPGVRDVLLRTLPRTVRARTRAFLAQVGGLIDERAGLAAGEFRTRTSTADTPAPADTPDAPPGEPFATVTEETVRRLGGTDGAGSETGTEAEAGTDRHATGTDHETGTGAETGTAPLDDPATDAPRPIGDTPEAADASEAADAPTTLIAGRYRLQGPRGHGRRVREAVDTRTGERVVVHLYPPQPTGADRFLREARILAGIDSPHLIRVLDHGLHDPHPGSPGPATPYLVARFEHGVTVAELVAGSGPGVSLPVFARLVCDGTAGLAALHAHGLVRGQPGWDGLLLRPDGTLLLSRYALGEQSEGRDARGDREAFERWLGELAALVPDVPPGLRPLLDEIRRGHVPPAARDRLAAVRDSAGLRVRLFGRPRLDRGDRSLELPGPEAQALLCMLVLAHGDRLTVAQLAEGLWDGPAPDGSDGSDASEGSEGPDSPERRVDASARELARVLGPGTVAATRDGYALHLAGASVDMFAAEAELGQAAHGHSARPAHPLSDEEVAGFFAEEPLRGVPGPAAAAARARLRGVLRQLDVLHGARTLHFTAGAGLTGRPETRITLEYAVHQVLSRGGLGPGQYAVDVRADGYTVRADPGTALLPVLMAVLRWLPDHWATLRQAPPLRVAFGRPRPAVDGTGPVVVVVPPALYDEFTASSAAAGPHRFHPLYEGPSPAAWYWPGAERRDLVSGPHVTPDLGRLGVPAPGRAAVVHTRPGGPPALLDPAAPYGGGPPLPVTYYEVDLTPQRAARRLTLPSSGKGGFTAAVELSWRVSDPVAFVRGDTADVAERLFAHLAERAPGITRRHAPRRAVGAQRALVAELGDWPVPGLAVNCAVTLAPEYAPPPEVPGPAPAPRTPGDLFAGVRTVLFGFDGPLVRLFTAPRAREAALELLALAVEHRDPEDALTGRPLAVTAARESLVHPLDVLRVFARDPVGPLLRRRLDELELRAVTDAPTTHRSVVLVRTLYAAGLRVGVVTDVCAAAVAAHQERHRLPLTGWHGRGEDLTRLMPHPDALARALTGQDAPALLVGSTPAELGAAQRLGIRFVGLARNQTVEQSLRAAGCAHTVPSLTPLLEAAQAL
ncbi:SAV_2336 N-terminal domain-related protein [Streptomyces longwoodensis]|uniref:SAV_2336 N-terminal domain-related protein n=1 Tax=Streptomyces longwoodensis TaxID=68231 RepID=UPI0038240E2A